MTSPRTHPAAADRLLERAKQIRAQEMDRLLARTGKSARLFERASRLLPFGVVSSFQKMQPYPLYVTRMERAATSGTRTAASTSTFTTASAPWSWGTPIPASSRRSTRRPAAARTSP